MPCPDDDKSSRPDSFRLLALPMVTVIRTDQARGPPIDEPLPCGSVLGGSRPTLQSGETMGVESID